MSIFTGLVSNTFIRMLLDYDLEFDDAMIVYASIAYTGFLFLSFLALFEGDTTAKYFMSWKDFEVSFETMIENGNHIKNLIICYRFDIILLPGNHYVVI